MRQQYSNWMASFFFSVNGRWSNWAAWSKCSKTCGNGTKTRLRTCTNPPPKYGGKCVGPSKQMKPCLEKRCPGLCVFHPVTVAFRFHECLADEVSGQVSTKSTMLLLPCRTPSISLNFLRVGKIF